MNHDRESHKRKLEQESKGRRLAKEMGDLVNIIGNDKTASESFVRELLAQHRTIQQAVFRDLVWPVICAWADHAELEYYDARNEGTVMACKKIKDSFKGDNEPILPTI